jgi:hypothetical protein
MKTINPCILFLLIACHGFAQQSRDTIRIVIENGDERPKAHLATITGNKTLVSATEKIFQSGQEPVFLIEKKVEVSIKTFEIGKSGCQIPWPAENPPKAVIPVKVSPSPPFTYSVFNAGTEPASKCEGLAESDLSIIMITYSDGTIDTILEKPSAPTPTGEGNTISFITPQMSESLMSPPASTTPTSADVQINWDIYRGDISLAGSPKTKRLKVGDMVRLHAFNYNPYRDSIRAEMAFNDYYSNSESQFTNLLNKTFGLGNDTGTAGSETTSPKQTGEGRGDGGDAKKKTTKDLIEAFERDVTNLYETLYRLNSIEPDQLDLLLSRFDSEIAGKFDLTLVTPSTIEAKGKNLIQSDIKTEEQAKFLELLTKGIAAYRKLKNYYRLNSLSIQIKDKDYTDLSVYLGRDGHWSDKPNVITWKNGGGSGIGYSVGAMGSRLRDYSYALKQVPTYRHIQTMDGMRIDTVYMDSIMRVDNGNFAIGILTLGHFYTRVPCLGINLAASAGVGLSGQLDDYYFLGGSVMFGKKRQFVISAGGVFAKVNRLEARYSEKELIPLIQGQTNSINTREVWDKNWFLAVTFQL